MHYTLTILVAALTKAVFPIISALVAGYAVVLAQKFANKLHIDAKQSDYDFIMKVAEHGVAMAEEVAASALKKYGKKISSDDTQDIALRHILSTVPAISRETAKHFADIAVAKTPWLGATGPKAIGPKVIGA